MDLKSVTEEAILLEKENADFYFDRKAEAKNKLVIELLDNLGKTELTHIDYIKKFYDAEEGKVNENILNEINEDGIKGRFINFINEVIKEKKPDLSSADDIKTLELAIEFEKKGYEFYHEASKKTENELVKKFFVYLRDAEIDHYTTLENYANYLKNPSGWFLQEEGPILDGGTGTS